MGAGGGGSDVHGQSAGIRHVVLGVVHRLNICI